MFVQYSQNEVSQVEGLRCMYLGPGTNIVSTAVSGQSSWAGWLQIVYFPVEKAYCASHQTAKVLDKVLRAGVLGEDDDEREDSPK